MKLQLLFSNSNEAQNNFELIVNNVPMKPKYKMVIYLLKKILHLNEHNIGSQKGK